MSFPNVTNVVPEDGKTYMLKEPARGHIKMQCLKDDYNDEIETVRIVGTIPAGALVELTKEHMTVSEFIPDPIYGQRRCFDHDNKLFRVDDQRHSFTCAIQ